MKVSVHAQFLYPPPKKTDSPKEKNQNEISAKKENALDTWD